jgi:hypothetical protein
MSKRSKFTAPQPEFERKSLEKVRVEGDIFRLTDMQLLTLIDKEKEKGARRYPEFVMGNVLAVYGKSDKTKILHKNSYNEKYHDRAVYLINGMEKTIIRTKLSEIFDDYLPHRAKPNEHFKKLMSQFGIDSEFDEIKNHDIGDSWANTYALGALKQFNLAQHPNCNERIGADALFKISDALLDLTLDDVKKNEIQMRRTMNSDFTFGLYEDMFLRTMDPQEKANIFAYLDNQKSFG